MRSALQCLRERNLKLFGKPFRPPYPALFPTVSHLRAMLLALLSSLDWLHHSFLHEAASLQGFSHLWPWQPKDQVQVEQFSKLPLQAYSATKTLDAVIYGDAKLTKKSVGWNASKLQTRLHIFGFKILQFIAWCDCDRYSMGI